MNEPTPIEQMRENASKLITSPTTGYTYRIHKISQIDFNRAQLSTVIPVPDGEEPETPDNGFYRRILTSQEFLLNKGAHVFFGDESATPEGWIHASWIAGDEGWLSDEILKFSELDTESQQRLNDLLKNANGSEKPMPSAQNLGDSLVSN